MKRLIICSLVLAGSGALALAQQPVAPTTPVNEQSVQFYRALLAEGGTQAVIQAVTAAVLEAMKQGPLTGEAGRATLASAGASSVPASSAPATPLVIPKTWADSVVWKGDVRYRTELRKDRGAAATSSGLKDPNSNVEYDRLRARLGLEAQVNDNVKAVVRLTTDGYGSDKTGNGGDPQSGNQDLNNGASKKGIYLDLAYIDWNLFGAGADELHAVAGKMNNPFQTMNDDLVWDPDTTPEGVALKGTMDLDPVTLFGNAGYFIVNNRNKASGTNNLQVTDNQVSLYGMQGGARIEFVPEVALTLGASYYSFYNIQGSLASNYDLMAKSTGTSFFGNTLKANRFVNDYRVIEPFAQLDMYPTVCGAVLPVSVFGQYVKNEGAESLNQGYMAGISLGKAKNPQTAEVGLSYAKLERDAVLGMWTDSDRWGGGTDGSGYKAYVKYMILKNLMGSVTYFNDSKGISKTDSGTGYERWQFDLTASF